MAVETRGRTDSERLAAIEATIPHLATDASLEKGLAALERRMLWLTMGLLANIIVTVLIYLR